MQKIEAKLTKYEIAKIIMSRIEMISNESGVIVPRDKISAYDTEESLAIIELLEGTTPFITIVRAVPDCAEKIVRIPLFNNKDIISEYERIALEDLVQSIRKDQQNQIQSMGS